MNRAFALLAGLLLASQVLAQPVAASALDTIGTPALLEKAKGKDETPPAEPIRRLSPTSNTFSAGDGDLHVKVATAWWQGKERHTTFSISNVGGQFAENVKVVTTATVKNSEGIKGEFTEEHFMGDILPNEIEYYTVVCAETGSNVCVSNALTAIVKSGDQNPKNNTAIDEV